MLDFPRGRISCYKPFFVNTDGSGLGLSEGVLDLFDYVLGSRSAQGEGTNQLEKLIFCNLVGKVDAGQTGGGQQLREAALGLPGL